MEKITLLLMFVVWVLFCMLEGKRDGSFYHANMTCINPVKENLHWLFTITRAIVMGLIAWICLTKFSVFTSFLFTGSLGLVFSFLHNGVYFLTRNQLNSNVYPKGFWDDSTSSTAKLEFSVKERTIMAVIGVVGIVTSIIIS